jgi:hypothetical protein
MIRLLAVGWTVLGIVALGVSTANTSNASPSNGAGQCSFYLSAPKVVKFSGVSMVAATAQAGACPVDVEPNSTVVCVSVEGDTSNGQCASEYSPDQPAIVYYPYRPGATYILSGKGCGQIFIPPSEKCQDLGPTRVTL